MADLPHGQVQTKVWPIYSALGEADIKPEDVKIRVYGEVEKEMELGWDALMKMPKVKKIIDFHCVTKWSRVGDEWEGVALKPLLALAGPKAGFLMFHCYEGYTANLPMSYVNDDAMLVYNFNGKALEKQHGGPMRAFIPLLYGWKSAKWIKEIEVMKEDRPGFWEERGYNMRGDWTKEERYWDGVNFVNKITSILDFKKKKDEGK